MSQNKDEGFISHLTELRKRLIQSFVCLLVLFVICYIFSEEIYNFLVAPYAEAVKNSEIQRRLIFTALQETFLTYIKVSFFTAFFFTSPFILIQIWKFIAPGLYEHEKSAIMPYLVVTPILFLLGGMLVYYLIMPLAIKFFLSFESTGITTSLPIQLEAKVNEYLSLVMKLIFAFGISFQLPVVLSLLARVGLVDSEFLKKRKPLFSLEFFPPKNESGGDRMLKTASVLKPYDPDFVSITYGAGGGTRRTTMKYARMLKNDFGFEVMPHLTCVGHTMSELLEMHHRQKSIQLGLQHE